MQQRGVTKESDSTWSCPVTLTSKKNRDVCFYMAYRKLNVVMKKDCFPLPWIDDTLDMLAGAKCIRTRSILHPRQVTLFGLCNVPATFERFMETTLRCPIYESYLVYLDVNVIGCVFQEHLHLREVFQWFQEAHLKLNLEKCQLFRRKYGTSGILCHQKG
jgi:hypothetical protein